jgi:hypothetical protein
MVENMNIVRRRKKYNECINDWRARELRRLANDGLAETSTAKNNFSYPIRKTNS